MKDDFLKSRKTCQEIESILESKHPSCSFGIGYSILRDQWEITISTSNTGNVLWNDFSLKSVLEKAENQQDFINILVENASLQAGDIIKYAQEDKGD
jgi:hypothetical protein